MQRRLALISLFAGLFMAACDSAGPNPDPDPDPDPDPTGIGPMPYDLSAPVDSFDLPEELLEISGITLLPDATIGAVQDEEGVIFVIDSSSGAVIAQHAFGEPDDYEDLETVGDAVYVLRADGDLFEVTGWGQDSLHAVELQTGLKSKNDTEGLAFLPDANRLLIACKGDPGDGYDKDEVRNVFAFDLTTQSLLPNPVLIMDRDTVDAVVKGGGKFAPAAIALHPIDDRLYVVSSDLRALAVYEQSGTLVAAHALPKALFEQPEGLLFLANGDMYISSEGVDGPGKLYRFTYAP